MLGYFPPLGMMTPCAAAVPDILPKGEVEEDLAVKATVSSALDSQSVSTCAPDLLTSHVHM